MNLYFWMLLGVGKSQKRKEIILGLKIGISLGPLGKFNRDLAPQMVVNSKETTPPAPQMPDHSGLGIIVICPDL